MPPSACASRPNERRCAPVNAPRSWPNNSESMSVAGIAPQSTITKGFVRRPLSWCKVCASISLPVPLSPVMSTVVSVVATRRVRASSSAIDGASNTNCVCWSAVRNPWTSACRRRRSCSARTRCSSARCSRSSATATCAATPREHVQVGAVEVQHLGPPHETQRAEGARVADQGHGERHVFRAASRRQRDAAVAGRARGHGVGHERALRFRDIGGRERARLGHPFGPFVPVDEPEARVLGDEQRGARQAQQRRQAADDFLREVGRAARARQRLQHVPQEAHVAIVLVGASGEDAEEPVGGRR